MSDLGHFIFYKKNTKVFQIQKQIVGIQNLVVSGNYFMFFK